MIEDEESPRPEQPADAPDEAIQPSARPDIPAQIVETVHASLYSGPIPPPVALAQYEKTLSGAADRILKMAESQRAHRQALEVVAIKHNARRSVASLIVGGGVALAALAVAGVLAFQGHPWFGIAAVLGTIVSLAGVFVYGTRSQREERTARLEETLNPTVEVSEAPTNQPSRSELPRE